MSAFDLTAEVLHWVYLHNPAVDDLADSPPRPHRADINDVYARGLLAERNRRWDLTEDGELEWATLQGFMAGAR